MSSGPGPTMPGVREPGEPDSEMSPPAQVDLTGRDRMTWNVVASWAGYLVEVAAGFVMPRLIDNHIGQTGLGIWDFAWSLVAYFRLSQIGVGASVNRYVAKHRAAGDAEGLRRVASSVMGLNAAAALLVLVLTAGAVVLVPWFLSDELHGYVASARWVVALLGAGLALNISCSVFPGVITGCHRWDLHNAVAASGQLLNLLGMVLALALGGGLEGLAIAHFGALVANAVMRSIVAYRVCPELRIRWADADLAQARRMLMFGAKFSVSGIARVVLVQTNSLVIVSHLGPAALAVFARPMALLRVVESVSSKFAFVLTPTASSLLGSGRRGEVQGLLLSTTRFGTALVAPMVLGLAILGDPVLRLWMGPRYEHGLILGILVLGHFLPMTQRPLTMILAGLNRHGSVALASVAGAMVGVALIGLNASFLGWGLPGFALAIVGPYMISTGVVLPIFACRRLGIPVAHYVREGYALPLACAIPFALVLAASRVLLNENAVLAVFGGSGLAGLVLAFFYWRYLLPERWRGAVVQRARRSMEWLGKAPSGQLPGGPTGIER